MPQVINTNVMSLNAQRNLTTSGSAMGQAIQRLSSGLRINSAKDDAAGLAISDRMTTQISGLNQAVRNANDGISLAQTTEGALQEVTNNLQRIRELSVQAANATNSASDLSALDQEVQQRIQEINRIATQTSFNGRKVLDGSFGGATFQVGANVGETITLQLDASVKSGEIGQIATASSADLDALFMNGSGFTLAANALTVNGNAVAATTYTSASQLAAAINTAATTNIAAVSGNEIAITNTTNTTITFAGSAAATLGLSTAGPATTSGGGFVLAANALTVNGTAVDAATYTTAQDLADAINDAYITSGGSGTLAMVNAGELAFSNTTNSVVNFGGAAAATLGLTTVGAATTAPNGFVLGANALLVNGTAVDPATYTDAHDLADAINDAYVTSGGTGTVATVLSGELQITNSNTSTGVTFTGAAASTLGLTNLLAAGSTPNPLVVGAGGFVITVAGGGTADITGTFNTPTDLVNAINAGANTAGYTGTFASLDPSGNLVLAADATKNVNISGPALADLLHVNSAITAGGASVTSTVTVASAFPPPTVTNTTGLSSGVDGAVTATGGTSNGSGASTAVNAAVTASGSTLNGSANSSGVNAAVTATGTPTPQTFATGEFTVKIGATGSDVDLVGTYDTAQDLADAINSKVAGAYASIDSAGVLSISSGDTLTLGGAKAGTGATGGLGFTTLTNTVAGSLNTANVKTTAGANDTILRVDAALTSVSTFRSTLGAIQNRFQSTINSLSAVSENLSASRSRILDTDFAAETAAMTRAQILQQAGTAMVAQANSAPQNVLSLLR